jgi:hypothetical protein
LIGLLAETLRAVAPDVTLMVRPYPMLADTHFFRELRERPNVVFDEEYRAGRKDRSLSRGAVFERLNLQEHAEAFAHCGTTMGLEGAYLETPVLILDPEDFDYGVDASTFMHLRRFIHQYHNQRYMLLPGYGNVVTSVAALRETLIKVLDAPGALLDYNRAIAAQMPLRSLRDVAESLVMSPACAAANESVEAAPLSTAVNGS